MRQAEPLRAGRRIQHGFTLVEAIMVIVITGIVAAMVAVFLKRPVDAYLDTTRRAELTDIADTALRRLARDVQTALPNSVRLDASGLFLEFVPVKTAGRYCMEPGTGAAWASSPCADHLDFSLSADSFDVLGPPVGLGAGDRIVIYNLGIPGADIYEQTSSRPAVATGPSSNIAFSSTGAPFPLESPGGRFHVVSTPMSYACDVANRRLLRYAGYGLQASQPASLAALDALATAAVLATDVTCDFTYDAELQRQGLVTARLVVARDGESVRLMHQINVSNTP